MHVARSVLILTLAFSPLFAAQSSGTLKNHPQPVLWSGTVTHGAGPIGEIPQCAPGCQRFDLTIDLPPGTWNNKPGGVEIALRWAGHTLSDNLKLYVFRNGVLLAKSDGIISTSQSVLIPTAPNGLYKIYAVYDDSTPESQSIAYEGLAEVEYQPKPNPLRQLIPDLEVRPQRNLSFDPVGVFFDTVSAQFPTCYQSEVDEEGARLCLRFDQIMANVGEGAMELRFATPVGVPPPASTNAYQRIYWSDSPSHYTDRLAGEVIFHPAHGHYHFASFGLSSLWKVDGSGKAVGPPVKKSHGRRTVGAVLTRTGRKVSFCLADIYIDAWAQKGTGARTYNAPDCLDPAFSDATGNHFIQGISSGWADVYDWYLPDQYIEVTGVPDGTYILQTEADPDNHLLETKDTNNCGSVYVRLSNMTSNARSAQILGPGPACVK